MHVETTCRKLMINDSANWAQNLRDSNKNSCETGKLAISKFIKQKVMAVTLIKHKIHFVNMSERGR